MEEKKKKSVRRQHNGSWKTSRDDLCLAIGGEGDRNRFPFHWEAKPHAEKFTRQHGAVVLRTTSCLSSHDSHKIVHDIAAHISCCYFTSFHGTRRTCIFNKTTLGAALLRLVVIDYVKMLSAYLILRVWVPLTRVWCSEPTI